jgi:hypothetical protein
MKRVTFTSWMHHQVGLIDTWVVLSCDVLTFRTFRSGMYRHVMFRAVGPYVAALKK